MSSAAVVEAEPQPIQKTDSFAWIVEDDMTCAVCLDLYDEPLALKWYLSIKLGRVHAKVYTVLITSVRSV